MVRLSRRSTASGRTRNVTRALRIHVHMANVSRDYLHKVSVTISKNHALGCVEDLNVRTMSNSAAGTPGYPGKNTRTNPGPKKAIFD
ncbi:transposase [Paraburkholderia youngii]